MNHFSVCRNKIASNLVSVVVSVGLSIECVPCAALLTVSPLKPHEYRRFSLRCVFLRPSAKPLAGILSPQRLPFRHPGDWQYKSNQDTELLQHERNTDRKPPTAGGM